MFAASRRPGGLSRAASSALVLTALASAGCTEEAGFPEYAPCPSRYFADEGRPPRRFALRALTDAERAGTSAVAEMTIACQSVAEALGVTELDRSAAETQVLARERLAVWCAVAKTLVQQTRNAAADSLSVDVRPARCTASVALFEDCLDRCSSEPRCDPRARPPLCEVGAMWIRCAGTCGSANLDPLECVGRCGGACSGTCSSSDGVECAGACDGVCVPSERELPEGTEGGRQPDGTCLGTCSGSCDRVPDGFACQGTCAGPCAGDCEGSPDAPVDCSGVCRGAFDELACEGGTLEGGCGADETCDSACKMISRANVACIDAVTSVGSTGGEVGAPRALVDLAPHFARIATIAAGLDDVVATRFDDTYDPDELYHGIAVGIAQDRIGFTEAELVSCGADVLPNRYQEALADVEEAARVGGNFIRAITT